MNLYTDDLPESFYNLERGAYHNYGIEVSNEEVWEEARESEDIPHVGNIIAQKTFSLLKEYLENNFPSYDLKVDYFVNGMDTHFYINGEGIHEFSEIKALIEDLNGND